MRNIFLAVACLILAVPALAGTPSTFEYRIENYPYVAGTCNQVAQKIAARFESVTGLKTLGAACRTEIWGEDLIVVHYIAEKALKRVSTFDDYALAQGLYATPQACGEALNAEVAQFRSSTGLAPVVAYCVYESGHASNGNPWVIRIDSFGEPLKRPFVFYASTYAKIASPSTIAAYVEQRLRQEAGVDVVGVRADMTHGGNQFVARYYAANKLPLSMKRVARFPDVGACAANVTGTQTILETVGAGPLALFCAQGEDYRGGELFAWTKTVSAWSREKAPRSFETYGECLGAREAMVELYRTSLKKDAVGAVCSVEDPSILEAGGNLMYVFVRQ